MNGLIAGTTTVLIGFLYCTIWFAHPGRFALSAVLALLVLLFLVGLKVSQDKARYDRSVKSMSDEKRRQFIHDL